MEQTGRVSGYAVVEKRRLVDAEKLRNSAAIWLDGTCLVMAVQDLDEAPTVDIVRCAECRYWGDKDGFLKCADGKSFGRCTRHNYFVDGEHLGWCPKEDDFCSCGERKKDG